LGIAKITEHEGNIFEETILIEKAIEHRDVIPLLKKLISKTSSDITCATYHEYVLHDSFPFKRAFL
jgi:hypothetical protein